MKAKNKRDPTDPCRPFLRQATDAATGRRCYIIPGRGMTFSRTEALEDARARLAERDVA